MDRGQIDGQANAPLFPHNTSSGPSPDWEALVSPDARRAGMYADLLRRTAEAAGKPVEGPGSSWADLPGCVKAMRDETMAFLRWIESFQGIGYFTNPEWESHIKRLRAALTPGPRKES